jgi:hypothetical protein
LHAISHLGNFRTHAVGNNISWSWRARRERDPAAEPICSACSIKACRRHSWPKAATASSNPLIEMERLKSNSWLTISPDEVKQIVI